MQVNCGFVGRALVAALALGSTPLSAESLCEPDGLQASGSLYRICMPPPAEYNGILVLWAHGFQDAGTPVEIPEDQLEVADTTIPEIVNGLGFAFATNSYRKTGLAVREGMEDLLDLVDLFEATHGIPTSVYLTGASEGGVITALLVEQRPDVFTAGLSTCGPIGSFALTIGYFGDVRVLFELFFPGVIPGGPFDPPPGLVAGWADYYEQVVRPIILAPVNRAWLDQLVQVGRVPHDPTDYLNSVDLSISDALRYSVVNLEDAAETLGGFPYSNRNRLYHGSSNDPLLNLLVQRVDADPVAIAEMHTHYDTSGDLVAPLVTMHTTQDQQIPFVQQRLYTWKTFFAGDLLSKHLPIRIERYEHCNFTEAEVLTAFALTLLYGGDLDVLTGVGSVLEGAELRAFERLARRHGLPYRIEGERLRALKGP